MWALSHRVPRMTCRVLKSLEVMQYAPLKTLTIEPTPYTLNLKPQTLNSKPSTLNSKSQILNSQP